MNNMWPRMTRSDSIHVQCTSYISIYWMLNLQTQGYLTYKKVLYYKYHHPHIYLLYLSQQQQLPTHSTKLNGIERWSFSEHHLLDSSSFFLYLKPHFLISINFLVNKLHCLKYEFKLLLFLITHTMNKQTNKKVLKSFEKF